MQRAGFVILGLLVCSLAGPASAFLSGYGYYQDATVNNTGSDQSYYQMNFTVNTSAGTSSESVIYLNSHAESDLDDLRFTDISDNIYPYFIENTANPYNIWVNITTPTGDSTVRVQYGNASTSSVSNITDTFPFGDEFVGTALEGAFWDTSGTVSVGSGIATVTGIGSQLRSDAVFAYGVNHSIRANISSSSASYINFGWEDGVSSSNFAIFYASASTDTKGMNRKAGGAMPTVDVTDFGTTYHIVDINRTGTTSVQYSVDGSTPASESTQVPIVNLRVRVHNGGTHNTMLDWIFVRNYTSTPPTIIAWSGESATASAPVAAFSANVTSGPTPLDILFTDESTNTPTGWDWSFDDGGSNSTDQNPVHTFNSAGVYTVALTASNDAGEDTETKVDYITVCDVPVSAFSANTTTGCAPLDIGFTDESTGTPSSWSWDVNNDGTPDYTTQNCVHTYSSAGTYTVNLTVSNCGGSDSEVKTTYITVGSAPTAAFSGVPTSGLYPLTVSFTDSSTGSPTSWSWDFDNDGTPDSSDQNPTTDFLVPGYYTVNLTATNGCGSDSEVKSNYITAGLLPTAVFSANVTSGSTPLVVHFTDSSSTGFPTTITWSWDVNNDGTPDYTTQNPDHTYTVAGTYTVNLTVTNAMGSDSEVKTGYITTHTLVPFPGCSSAPTDIDADGYYEDVNGNGRLDWSDGILFFQYLAWAQTNEPQALFDFANDGGTIGYSDTRALYTEARAAL